jgi:hypothetical protein
MISTVRARRHLLQACWLGSILLCLASIVGWARCRSVSDGICRYSDSGTSEVQLIDGRLVIWRSGLASSASPRRTPFTVLEHESPPPGLQSIVVSACDTNVCARFAGFAWATGEGSYDPAAFVLAIPLWPIVLFGGLTALATRARLRTRVTRTRAATGHCPSCHYNLTGNVSGICPECGVAVAPSA